jgi:predicted DCC family thiol-disulfide oxidoreductase YuxK
MKSSHLVMPDGTVHSGGDSVEPLARLLPLGAPAALLARAAPGLMDRGYRLIAGNRMKVSKLVPAASKARADERIQRRLDELEQP